MRKTVYGLSFKGIEGAASSNLIRKGSLVRKIDIVSYDHLFEDRNMMVAMMFTTSLLATVAKHKFFVVANHMMDALEGKSNTKEEFKHWAEIFSWKNDINPFRSYIMFKMSQFDDNQLNDADCKMIEEAVILEGYFDDVCSILWSNYAYDADLVFDEGHWYIFNQNHKKEINIDQEFFYKNILHRIGFEKEGRIFFPITIDLFLTLSNIISKGDLGMILCM